MELSDEIVAIGETQNDPEFSYILLDKPLPDYASRDVTILGEPFRIVAIGRDPEGNQTGVYKIKYFPTNSFTVLEAGSTSNPGEVFKCLMSTMDTGSTGS